jgi:uncharacterized protein (DUF362 family)
VRPLLFTCLVVAVAGCHRTAPPAPTLADGASPTSGEVAGPDVSTHASTLAPEDAEAPVEVSGAVDANSLRARNRARIAADRSPVVVLQGTGARAAFDLGQRLCEAVVPHKPADTPFLLKPNLGGFDWFKDADKTGGDDGMRGRTTDPEFVRGVVRCLRARGHEHVTIAEGWGATHKDWEKLVQVSGYARMAREEKVPLVALDDDGVFDVQGDQPGKPLGVRGMEATGMPTLLVPKLLADTLAHGVFISLPKIKAHRYAVFSLSVKGMQGTIMTSDKAPAFHNKWRTHRELVPWMKKQGQGKEDRAAYVASLEKFADRIADVLEVEAPDVVLAEGAPMMGGDGFEKLWPSAEKVAVGGTNPILVDRVGAQLLGLWDRDDLARELGGHRTSPLLEVAARRFGVDIASPAVTGDGAALLSAPRPAHFVAMASFAVHSDGRPALTPAGIGALGSPPTPPSSSVPSSPMTPPSTRVAHAANLGDDTLVIDGRAVDDAWKRAMPIAWDTDTAGESTGIETRVRFLHARTGLFVLWELQGAGLNTDRTRPTTAPRPKLYEEDCVELFFTPDPKRPHHYFETELGPFAHYLDVEVDRDAHTSSTAWSSGAHVAATQDAVAHAATIEAELTSAPFLEPNVVPGAKLPLGCFRMEGTSPRRYLAWSPPRTPHPDFHVPSAFGTLVIDP